MNEPTETLAEVAAERDRLKRGGAELGKSLKFWMDLAVEATGSQDLIEADGDGDWGAVAERLAAIKPSHTNHERLDRARAEADHAHGPGISSIGSPDARTIPSLLAGILDALLVIADTTPLTADPRTTARDETRTP